MQADIQQSKAVLDEGGIILFPTDSGWSFGCDATNSKAIARMKELNPGIGVQDMVVLLDTEVRMERYVEALPEVAWELLEVSEKPITLVLPGAKNLADNLLNKDGSVAFRVTNDKFIRILIQQYKKPLAACNPAICANGKVLISEIPQTWLNDVDYLVKTSKPGLTSDSTAIIKLGTSGEIQILKK